MFRLWTVLIYATALASAATVSPLAGRGYHVIPEPQKVTLRSGDFRFGGDWAVELGAGVRATDVAADSLKADLQSRFGLTLGSRTPRTKTVRLEIGAVENPGKAEAAEQAYRIELAPERITITGVGPAGLFYGTQTLVQLLSPREGQLQLPEGRIEDWPDLPYRSLYWDDAHHLDRFEELKRSVRQAAFFKINAFVIKLEGHFQFKSVPALVEPQALSPQQLQELTDYGLRYFVQVVPYLDGPAHIAFILKHPEYAKLRSFPDSNYELCATNPDAIKLMQSMYQDLLDANKGVKYFYLSTDESYYIGLAKNGQCDEVTRAKELGSVGKLLGEFLDKTASYLRDRGRTVIFWGETPLQPEDIASLPAYLVNGETYGPKYDPLFKKRGIKSMFYTSTQGAERLFPDYFIRPASERLHQDYSGVGRVPNAFEQISYSPARKQADIVGALVAGWADAGLHTETFWLGYVGVTAAMWHPGSPDPQETMNSFYPIFYGPRVAGMGRLYQLMSTQAQFWDDSWETIPTTARKPIFGNSENIYKNRRPVFDQTIPLPPLPSPEYLTLGSDWSKANARRLELANNAAAENEELMSLLHENLLKADFNHYNLEVYVAIANLYRHNLRLLKDLARINASLEAAQASGVANPEDAVTALDQALDAAAAIKLRRNRVLADATETWYKSWLPRVSEANGRRFLHELDDVKDHEPDRTVDMSYLVYRELLLPFDQWADNLQSIRNQFAGRYKLPTRMGQLNWKDTATLTATE